MRKATFDLGIEVFEAGAPVSAEDLVARGYHKARNGAAGLLWRLVNGGHWRKCGGYYPAQSAQGEPLEVMILTEDEAQLIKERRQAEPAALDPWDYRGWGTPAELAEAASCNPRAIDRWIREGRIGALKEGGEWRIPAPNCRALIKWVKAHPETPPGAV